MTSLTQFVPNWKEEYKQLKNKIRKDKKAFKLIVCSLQTQKPLIELFVEQLKRKPTDREHKFCNILKHMQNSKIPEDQKMFEDFTRYFEGRNST